MSSADEPRPSIDNIDQQELRQRAMTALRELLTRLGEQQPIVLYIDDLQRLESARARETAARVARYLRASPLSLPALAVPPNIPPVNRSSYRAP